MGTLGAILRVPVRSVTLEKVIIVKTLHQPKCSFVHMYLKEIST